MFEREPQLPVIKVYNAYKGYTSYLKYFGNPLVVQVPKKEMSYKDFVIMLYLRMRWVFFLDNLDNLEQGVLFLDNLDNLDRVFYIGIYTYTVCDTVLFD